ncbi:MAG TPA: hypothetical protein VLY04_20870 [Bryobacteraceae bacterium]|nr:hypothetical protein [Bryobacteraceae bacterium]
MALLPIAAFLLAAPAFAATPRACAGGSSLGTFRIAVRRPKDPSGLPLKSVSVVPAGAHLVWNPVHIPVRLAGKAEIAALLVPSSDGDLIALKPRKAAIAEEWAMPKSPGVIALIFGPQGLNMGKVKSLVKRDQGLLTELADYAEQTSEVESLIQELADAEQTGGGADAALQGFSSQYGVALPKLNSKASSNQQATTLLNALMPSAKAYDPLAPQSTQMQQSGGLAASVAGLFFGSPVGLAAGGTVLFENLKTVLFPGTEFRSAFAQSADKDDLGLCTKNQAFKPRTHIAYLWAYRVPGFKEPAASLAGASRLPLGAKSAVKLTAAEGSTVKELQRARDWRITPVDGGAAIPVTVSVAGAADTIEIDLSKINAKPGDYRLSAIWDWDPLAVAGTLHLQPPGDFSHVRLAPGEQDRLVEGHGTVKVKLTGTDFEFVEKAAVEKAVARPAQPPETTFELPLGAREGEQDSIEVTIDTSARGSYRLLLTQADKLTHEIPFTVLPPNPKITNLPLLVNVGEARRPLRLEGSGLERVEAVSSEAGAISGGAAKQSWAGEIQLRPNVAAGQTFPLVLRVKGLESPVTVPDAIEIVGPRPRISSARKSAPGNLSIELREDELPAGTTVGLVLMAANLHDTARPKLDLNCATGELRKPMSLAPDEQNGGASLSFAGPGALYLSFDPGTVGYPGCRLTAVIQVEPEGRSDPIELGSVMRVPRLDEFTLTTEQLGPATYAGQLKGRDLEMVEKAGWDAEHGLPVESIPAPVPGDPSEQKLRIALPWPAPAPHAPLFVWLRGEHDGRKTAVTY